MSSSSHTVLKDFLRVFFVPILINKMVLLYFGIHYAAHPDEGYGYGLAASIAFFIFTMSRFLWKYRNIEDP